MPARPYLKDVLLVLAVLSAGAPCAAQDQPKTCAELREDLAVEETRLSTVISDYERAGAVTTCLQSVVDVLAGDPGPLPGDPEGGASDATTIDYPACAENIVPISLGRARDMRDAARAAEAEVRARVLSSALEVEELKGKLDGCS